MSGRCDDDAGNADYMYSLFNRRGAEVWFRDDWQKVVE